MTTKEVAKIEEITEQDFLDYEEVRISGRTNMFVITMVESLSGLPSEKIRCIMRNYSQLCSKYPTVRKVSP